MIDLDAIAERFAERAAICQHDGKMPQEQAERLAWAELLSWIRANNEEQPRRIAS